MTDTTPPLLIAPPPPGWRAQPIGSPEADRLARQAMIFGIVSLVANLLLIPSIIGIVHGRRSLRLGTTERSMAIAGVATGGVGLGVSLISLLVLLPLSFLLRGLADTELQHGVESSITTLASHQGATLTDVVCPAPHDPRAGSTLVCTAQDGSTGQVQVVVTFTSPTTFTARIAPVG